MFAVLSHEWCSARLLTFPAWVLLGLRPDGTDAGIGKGASPIEMEHLAFRSKQFELDEFCTLEEATTFGKVNGKPVEIYRQDKAVLEAMCRGTGQAGIEVLTEARSPRSLSKAFCLKELADVQLAKLLAEDDQLETAQLKVEELRGRREEQAQIIMRIATGWPGLSELGFRNASVEERDAAAQQMAATSLWALPSVCQPPGMALSSTRTAPDPDMCWKGTNVLNRLLLSCKYANTDDLVMKVTAVLEEGAISEEVVVPERWPVDSFQSYSRQRDSYAPPLPGVGIPVVDHARYWRNMWEEACTIIDGLTRA